MELAVTTAKGVEEAEDEMKRVASIPLSELDTHFRLNIRQDVKIIAPEIMDEELFQRLVLRGKKVKREEPFERDWIHSDGATPNRLCLSDQFDYATLATEHAGPLAVSFANENAEQDSHYHKQHLELYYSEHPIGAQYRMLDGRHVDEIDLNGGVIIFGPEVVHKMSLKGLTIIIEIPSVKGDKFNDLLVKS